PRSIRSSARSSGSTVSARPSPAIVETRSAAVGWAGHGQRSAAGAMSAVRAMPGTRIATDRLATAARPPPNPTATRAAAMVSRPAATTWVSLPANWLNGPRSEALAGVAVHGRLTQRYGPSSAAATAGATKTITIAAGS